MAQWPHLSAGAKIHIVKVSPEGEIVAEYDGSVVDADARSPWLAACAIWTHKITELDGLTFVPQDHLHEFFSPAHWFNVFSIWSPENELRGWYANVTRPAQLNNEFNPPKLFWYDLYVDLIALPSGAFTIRDEDELAESGLDKLNPELHARILKTRDELIRLFKSCEFPFHES